MNEYMAVCTFKEGTVMDDVRGVIAQEQTAASALQAAGKIGSIHLATLSRGRVFVETFAASVEEATATVQSLPMSVRWDIDVCSLSTPGQSGAAS